MKMHGGRILMVLFTLNLLLLSTWCYSLQCRLDNSEDNDKLEFEALIHIYERLGFDNAEVELEESVPVEI